MVDYRVFVANLLKTTAFKLLILLLIEALGVHYCENCVVFLRLDKSSDTRSYHDKGVDLVSFLIQVSVRITYLGSQSVTYVRQ